MIIAVSLIFLGLIAAAGFAAWMLHSNLITANNDQAVALQENVDPSELRGEGDGRVNILLIGADNAASLSDSIVLLSLDPVAKDVAMLSIPRDLYVDIPGYGSAKINAAHAYGEQYDYEGGGPQLLKDTLEETLSVPVHYYARANFQGFKEAVDTLGGVEVEVEEPIVDNQFPSESDFGYQPFHLEAGTHQMDGELALKYARSRYSTSDFDRSRRQQKLLLAAKEKALSLGTLSNPAKVTSLLRSFSGNVRTDMQIEEIMRLREIAEDIGADDIASAQLSDENYLSFSNVHGQSVLVPNTGDFGEVQKYVRGLLIDSYIKDEGASISVLNGTTVAGLAADVSSNLRSYGYDVGNVDNASEQNYTRTVIFDYNGDNPYTLRYLEERFGVTAQRRTAPADRPDTDIEIVIGSDYDPSTQ